MDVMLRAEIDGYAIFAVRPADLRLIANVGQKDADGRINLLGSYAGAGLLLGNGQLLRLTLEVLED